MEEFDDGSGSPSRPKPEMASRSEPTRPSPNGRRFFGTPFGLVVVLAAFAMPWMAVAQYCDDGNVPSSVSGDIYGYKLIVGGSVSVSNSRAGEVAGLIDGGRISPDPIAVAVLLLAVTGLIVALRRRQPAALATITVPGVIGLAGLVAWAALPFSLDSRLVDPDSFTMWRFGGLVVFVGFVWAVLASHSEAIRPKTARVLIGYNVVVIVIFLLNAIPALERASTLASGPLLAVVAVDAIVILVKWVRGAAATRSSTTPSPSLKQYPPAK